MEVLIQFFKIPIKIGIDGKPIHIVAAIMDTVRYPEMGYFRIFQPKKNQMDAVSCLSESLRCKPSSIVGKKTNVSFRPSDSSTNRSKVSETYS